LKNPQNTKGFGDRSRVPRLARHVSQLFRKIFADVKNLPDCTAIVIFRRATDPNMIEQRKEQMTKSRFIKSVVKSAEENTTRLPWARGSRRAAFIAKRRDLPMLRKSA